MSAVSILQTAVTLAKQGVHQDKAKNYTEAARCYRESIATFASIRHKSANAGVAKAIDEKIEQYRDRLRKIDRYLLSKADLSNVFKSAVNHHTVMISQAEEIQRLVERAKRRDGQRRYLESIDLYEKAMAGLLEMAMTESDTESAEKIRFRCLLIHERVDAIRNYLETGSPVASTSIELDAIDGISETSSLMSQSPEPIDSEEHIMLMTPFQSETNLASSEIVESRHSLYPMCEIRSASVASGNSDIGSGGSGVASGSNDSPIPLANMDQELSLSTNSIQNMRMMGIHSADMSPNSSQSSLKRYRSLHLSNDNVLSPLSITVTSTSLSFEKDRNLTEIECEIPKCSAGSDSGISNPENTPKRSIQSLVNLRETVKIQKAISMTDLTRTPSPKPVKELPQNPTPTPKVKKMDSMDELTVISTDVVDHTEPKMELGEYRDEEPIPPRSMATREENEIGEGCFMFLSCLDAFGIL